MGKSERSLDLETRLRSLEVIFQKDVFRILSALTKHQDERTSFTWLKSKLNLNSNSLSKHLKKLSELRLVDNYYKKEENEKHYSFYKITSKGLNLLNLTVGIPRVWEIMSQFREYCRSKGWKTLETEGWVQADGKYHNFLQSAHVHPATLKRVSSCPRMAIPKGKKYVVVHVAYTSWIFTEIRSGELATYARMVIKDPKLVETTAIYDLTQAYLMSPQVMKLNKTDSEVFREFEYFLKTRWKLEFIDLEDYLREAK